MSIFLNEFQLELNEKAKKIFLTKWVVSFNTIGIVMKLSGHFLLFPFQLVTQMRFSSLFHLQITIVIVQSEYIHKRKKCIQPLAKIVTASFDLPLSDSNSPHQMFFLLVKSHENI